MENVSRADVLPELLANGNTIIHFGRRAKDGCSICYLFPGRIKLSHYKADDMMRSMVYFADECYKNETLDAFRKGCAYVEDLTGVGLSTFDMGESKNFMQNFQHIFPQKITHIYIVNPPLILKALIGLARMIVKQKIIKRVSVIDN